MAIKKLEEFVNQRAKYPFPDEDVNPNLKKEPEYYMAVGRAMIADFTNNVYEIPYSYGEGLRTHKELHQYATGTYPNSKLKDQAIGTSPRKKKNGKHLTKMNISFSTFPIISKFLEVMREKNMRQAYDVDAYCIDDDSIQAKEADKAMLKYLVQKETKELMIKTKFKPNFKIDPVALGIENEQDVDLYFECGAYVFEREMASIAACNKTKLLSKYKVIQDGTFDDLIKYGKAVWKTEIDPTTKTPIIRRVNIYDPELDMVTALIPYSTNNNFDNFTKGGEIRKMTIQDLRRENPWLNAQQLRFLIESYADMNNGYSSLIGGLNSTTSMADINPLNRCVVLVLDYQWLGTDIQNYVKNEKRTLFKAEDFDYEVSSDRKRKGDRKVQKKVVKKHVAKWVIGTDILLSYGQAEDNIYYGPDGDRCPGIDYFATKTGNLPLIEKCIAIQDDVDLANVKLRNAMASAIPAPRMVIQTGLLDNVFLNNIKQQPEDNMATFRELGYLMVNAVDDDGKPIFTNQKLVDFLPMGIQEDINVFTGQILAGINNMREVLGIAQGADGSTPQKYDGVRKTELSAASSNAALFPTFNCYQYLFEDAFNDIVKKWQIVAKDHDVKLNYGPLGQKNMQVLKLGKDFTNADMNIVLTLGSTEDQLMELLGDIKELRALGIQTQFAQGITTSEYIYLSETIRSGNTKQAMWVMAKVEQKKIAAQKVIDQQNQENNIAAQQNSAAQAEINKQATVKIQGSEDRLTIMLEEGEKRKTAIVSGMLKTFTTEKDVTPIDLYKSMMEDADAQVIGVLQQSQAQQQPAQEEQMEDPNAMPAQPEVQQQVA